MNDVFSYPEIMDWENRISKIINKNHSYFCEVKLDGLSIKDFHCKKKVDGYFFK